MVPEWPHNYVVQVRREDFPAERLNSRWPERGSPRCDRRQEEDRIEIDDDAENYCNIWDKKSH